VHNLALALCLFVAGCCAPCAWTIRGVPGERLVGSAVRDTPHGQRLTTCWSTDSQGQQPLLHIVNGPNGRKVCVQER